MTWRKAELTIGDGQWGFGTVWGGPSGDAGVYPISSPFGPRDPFGTPNGATSGFHQGLDIAYPEGVPLVALFRARITHVSIDHPSYGNYVIYEPADLSVDDDGWAQVWYGHMSSVSVGVGDGVEEGTLLGRVGSTGMATGPHLHLEVRNRMGPIDPFNALMAGGLGNSPAVTQPTYQPLTREQVIERLNAGAIYIDLAPATQSVIVFTN